MRRAYKFQLRPTKGQIQRMDACLEAHRLLYNAALEERIEAWRMCGKRISFAGQSAQVKDIRAADPTQAQWGAGSQVTTVRRLDRAFQAFFRRVKAGATPGFPRFKSRDRWDSVTWMKDRSACRWNSGIEGGPVRVMFQGIGHVRVHQHREIKGRVRTLTLKREGRRWYVIVSCDEVPQALLEATGAVVGVDVGIASFATTSSGVHIANPRHGRTLACRLAGAQQSLATKQRGSRRRGKQRELVAGIHRKIRNQRLDFHHKVALDLVRAYDLIALESLNIAGMSRAPKPKPDPDAPGEYLPNGRASKAGLNRSILDAGWGQFANIVVAKAEEAGRQVVFVNPRNTSKHCHQCGAVCERPVQATVICPEHGSFDADLNGALNILRAGLALQDAQAA